MTAARVRRRLAAFVETLLVDSIERLNQPLPTQPTNHPTDQPTTQPNPPTNRLSNHPINSPTHHPRPNTPTPHTGAALREPPLPAGLPQGIGLQQGTCLFICTHTNIRRTSTRENHGAHTPQTLPPARPPIKVSCTKCGTLNCYVCRALIDKRVGYAHFCQVLTDRKGGKDRSSFPYSKVAHSSTTCTHQTPPTHPTAHQKPLCTHAGCGKCPLWESRSTEEEELRKVREAGLKANEVRHGWAGSSEALSLSRFGFVFRLGPWGGVRTGQGRSHMSISDA